MSVDMLTAPVELPDPLSEDELVGLGEDAFIDYVRDCLTSADRFIDLNRPSVVGRTMAALGELIHDWQQVADEHREDMTTGAYHRWWFDVGRPLEELMQKRLARSKGSARGARETEFRRRIRQHKAVQRRLLDVIGRLAEEIHHHRLAVVAAGFAPEVHDSAMWSALGALSIPVDGEDVRLDEALGQHLIGGAR